ncbi:HDOD domain-containing protein [Endothiovibrio diazotrophicus]
MSEDLYQKLAEAVERMPAFPESVHRVMELTADINCLPKDLVEVIERDVVMTAKLLKWVNSPYFGLASKIQNINHAVVYVGLNTIKNLALSIATIGTLPSSNKAGFDVRAFLAHSLATATTARTLAQKSGIPEMEASNYFVAGLLHDFGKAVFALFMADEFRAALEMAQNEGIALHEAERQMMGTDHAETGAMLCEKWKLSDELIGATRDHHALSGEPTLMRDCVFVANQVVKKLQFGDSGNPLVEPIPPSISGRLGGPLKQLFADMDALQDELKKATAFIGGKPAA